MIHIALYIQYISPYANLIIVQLFRSYFKYHGGAKYYAKLLIGTRASNKHRIREHIKRNEKRKNMSFIVTQVSIFII